MMESLQNYWTDSDEEVEKEVNLENTQLQKELDGLDKQSESHKKTKEKLEIDFFNLDNDSESDEELQQPLNKKKRKEYFIDTKQGEQISIPQSEFWENFSVEEAKICIDKQCTENQAIKHSPDIKNLNKTDDKNFGKFTAQHQQYTSIAFPREECRNAVQKQQSPQNSIMKTTHKQENHGKRQYYYIHSKVAPHLSSNSIKTRYPTRSEKHISAAHEGVINRVKWNVASYSHLFLSASMDGTIKIWNIWSQLEPCLLTLKGHSKAVRDAVWSVCGRQILSCSFDKTAAVTDVETAQVLNQYSHTSYVSSCKFHPSSSHICITGSQNLIQAWDSRSPGEPCRSFTYKDRIGQVQDLLFSHDGDFLFSASDELNRDTSDRNIMAWDFKSSVVLSNQIYQERFSCTRLKLHPHEGHFLAQSHGNYIAIFSTNRPYKMNKAKRFEGHKLAGYSIGFDVTPDGATVISGDASGKMYLYHYVSGKQTHVLNMRANVCMDVSCHPVLPSTLVCCSWDGSIDVCN